MDRGRRGFLKGIGAIGAAGLVPRAAQGDSSVPATAPVPDAGPATAVEAEPYGFLTAEEAAWLEAAINRMVPADELGPGGVDLGIARFIDRQLAGAFGQGAKTYMQGPWQQGTPAQGWQIPLTPAACYRSAIARIDAYCREARGAAFRELAVEVQDDVLAALEAGKIDLVELPGHVFFKLFHQNVMEGLFSDPIYGGNRDRLGWKLVGFPGALGNYVDVIDQYDNKPFPDEPVGIEDLAMSSAR
jgi:gluconate 2-dehydrogenase gamma chain